MSTLFIINGRVIDPAAKVDAKLNVLIRDGKIAELTSSKQVPPGAQVIDAKGCIVAPGFIDMHVHLREPGFEYKEDIESGTRAAAAGGFTTVCCMPNTNPVNDCAAVTGFILERARAAGCTNVVPIGAISRGLTGETMADIGDMAAAGVAAITDDGKPVTDAGLMRRAMEYAKGFDLPVVSHCEVASLAVGVINEGAVSAETGMAGTPAEAEEIMVSRDIMLAGLTGARLHIAHVSTAGSVRLIREAKARGIKVTAEATPHHMSLTEEAVLDFDPNTKMNPPLRTEGDRNALIKALSDGTIDCIATDHAPHAITDKEVGFEDASCGIVGLETMLPLMLGHVHEKHLTLKRLIEALTMAPARILKLAGKGTIKAGSPADVVVFDPEESYTIQAARFASKGRNTPFDGLRVRGRVRCTICGGEVVFKA